MIQQGYSPFPSHSHHRPVHKGHTPGTPLNQHEKLVKGTQKLLSQTFFGTLLKQMRDSPFKSKIFDGGRGGQAFSAMLDQHLADRMSRGTGNKLAEAMAKRLTPSEHPSKNAPKDPAAEAQRAAMRARFEQAGEKKSAQRRPNVKTDFRA